MSSFIQLFGASGATIKSLQRGVFSGSTTTDITISAVDPSKTEVSTLGWAFAPGLRAYLLNATTLRFEALGGQGTSFIPWEVRELAGNVKQIQRGLVAASSASSGTISIAAVNPLKTSVRNLGCLNNDGQGRNVSVYLQNATTLAWSQGGGTNLGGFSWELTEYIQ